MFCLGAHASWREWQIDLVSARGELDTAEPFHLCGLLELRVFHPRVLENRDVRIGIIPEGEEILISSFCLNRISRERERPAELQARQRADRIGEDDPAMVEDLLKFGRGFRTSV